MTAIRNALTFDVEEYFHAEVFAGVVAREQWAGLESRVVRATEQLVGLLAESATRATFFVLGWVAERHPGLLRAIAAEGHELACHGYAHEMITRLSRAQFSDDVRRAKAAVEDAAGVIVVGYRAPTFSVVRETMWSLEVLAKAGFQYDSSIFPVVHDRYGIPDAPRFPYRVDAGPEGGIVEFPLSTVTRFGWRFPVAGGGYFRLLPYAVTRWAVRQLNGREGQPAIVYLHPWEVDPGQPRLPVGRVAQLRHSVNTGSTLAKLRRLLGDFAFAPVREVLGARGAMAPGWLG
jgi:polysaccharide deacetylase family protein (PEP-CTERM system associated)